MAKAAEIPTKSDAIREAAREGITKPGDIVEYVKKKYSLDITPGQASTTLSLDRKRAAKAGGATVGNGRPARGGRSAKLSRPAPITGSVSDDLTALAELVKRYGADEVTRLVALLGREVGNG